jgi:ABC-type glycerol-3-phosphate transport system substrate-binding protein
MIKKRVWVKFIIVVLLIVSSLFLLTGQQQNVNLRGANIKVASWWSTYNVNTYQPRSESEEQELEYRRRVLSQHGFNFQVAELSNYDNYLRRVASNIMAGNREWSIYEVAPVMAVILYKHGLLYPIGNSRAVNFNNREATAGVRPMYNRVVQETMTFNGVQYGWQYGLPNNSWGQAMLFFNVKHLTDVGLNPEYIYNLQRNNNWTWDTFLDLCRRLTRNGIYAFPMDDAREILRGFIYGNGANFVTFDAQGRAHNATNSPAFIEALQFYNTLINEGLVLTRPRYDWGWNWTAFQEGRVAMTFDPEWRKGQTNFEAGYVLPPRGPRQSQPRMDASDNVYVIPAFFSPQEVDVILKAAELWFTPVDTDWLHGGHAWASTNLRDLTETVMMSRDARFLTPRCFFLVPGFPFDDFITDFRNGLGRTDPEQVIQRWTPRFNAAINEFNR